MKTPFKFLDAFTPEDKDSFFGRDEEIDQLYDMVTKNRLMLIYGQSGTGKTSLVQCGLAGRFDATDWLPVFIRRQNNLNQSLERALLSVSNETSFVDYPTTLERIFNHYLLPVYLVFDQMEELFILGDRKEIVAFTAHIKSMLEARTALRVLFVIREEYLFHLYELERDLPYLFDRRMRVEPLSHARIHTVLEGSFRKFNIQPDKPETQTYDSIIRQISSEKTSVQLPFLQVWLDRFYRKAYAEQHPDQNPDGAPWQPLAFSRDQIDRFGTIGNVLEGFLLEQKSTLEADMKARFPKLEDGTVGKILDGFVTEEGTKRPIGYEWKEASLYPEKRWATLFHPISPEALGYCCRRLEQARLLRFTEAYMELAHDALAAYIDSQRSISERRLQEAHNRLTANFREHQETGEFLTRRQLNYLEEFLPALHARLNDDLKQFVSDSRERAEAAERAELMAEKRKRRLAVVLALTFGGLAMIAYSQFRTASNARAAIARKAIESRLEVARIYKVQGKYPEALSELGQTRILATDFSPASIASIDSLDQRWHRVKDLFESGQQSAQTGDLRATIAQLDAARGIDSDSYIESRLEQTRKDLETTFRDCMIKGEASYNAKEYDRAVGFYEKAKLLKPENAAAGQKLEQARLRH
jgi:hypothetical protein